MAGSSWPWGLLHGARDGSAVAMAAFVPIHPPNGPMKRPICCRWSIRQIRLLCDGAFAGSIRFVVCFDEFFF